MSATTELLGELITVHGAATAKADLESTLELFDEDDGDLSAGDGKCQIDGVFGIAGQCARFREILFANKSMDQAPSNSLSVRDKIRPRSRTRPSVSRS